jgi:octaprenyl-diphosphate synthase
VQPSSSPPDLAQLFEPVRDDLERVNQAFLRHIDSRVELIPEIGKYLQNTGGKRVRPAVMLMAGRLAGGEASSDMAVLYASVIEFIHTATLVHDDIIDDSELRRGRLAVHSRWGNEVTVLLGDYLYIKSLGMAMQYDRIDVLRVLCDITLKMIEGELYQLTKAGDANITEAEHLEIIRRKTAFLFSGCAEIGAALGAAPAAQRAALRDYGFDLGTAFQIVDDVLDYMADASALGKPLGGDLREGKVTLPVILLLQKRPDMAPVIQSVIAEGEVQPETWRMIQDLLRREGAVDAAFERAVGFASRAKQHMLDAFPPSTERDGLIALADYVVSRDR